MSKPDFSHLKAMYVNCTLKKWPRKSHTQGLIDLSLNMMKSEGVKVEQIRFVDQDIPFGAFPDMTEYGYKNDEWPKLFDRIFDADILIIGTPIWLGERSSVASHLIERLYAMSGKRNEKGQYMFYGKVGGCIVTGNEDGLKNCSKGILYALQHIGYSIPPQADCGWIGEVGPGPSYLDDKSDAKKNDFTNRNTTFMTYNLMHLAKILKENGGYPSYGNSTVEWDQGNRWSFKHHE